MWKHFKFQNFKKRFFIFLHPKQKIPWKTFVQNFNISNNNNIISVEGAKVP